MKGYIITGLVALTILNHFINLVNPLWVMFISVMFIICGAFFVFFVENDTGHPKFETQHLPEMTWVFLLGIMILVTEIFVPYNIMYSYTQFTMAEEIRLFFASVAERMFTGLQIVLVGCFVFGFGIGCYLLFESYIQNNTSKIGKEDSLNGQDRSCVQEQKGWVYDFQSRFRESEQNFG